MNSQPIGFLDSGVGGLTVVKEVIKLLPNEEIIYIGDSGRNPYGPRPLEEVRQFTHQLSHFLMKKEIKLLVVACNTATVAALDSLQKELPIPVIGVIESGTKAAIEVTKNNKIGIIGTQGTIQSGEYEKQILEQLAHAELMSVACPKFVSIVEKNQFETEQATKIVTEELAPFENTDIDTLVLGCTHYPLLQVIIQNNFDKHVTLVDPGVETAKLVKKYLESHDLLNLNKMMVSPYLLFTTGSAAKFHSIASKWLGTTRIDVQHISIEELTK